ncbi:transcriptional repressor NrdR [bacterium]|nr:transcriptional repressor NrdR [bacterium]
MNCPFCGGDDTRVVDSRPAEGGAAIRRRRECERCSNRFTTYERRDEALVVIKRDGSVQPFSPSKVFTGLGYAVADLDIPPGSLDRIVREIEMFVREEGPRVNSEDIGHRVLDALRDLDEVAYLRFASVYKEFRGASDFEVEMAALEEQPRS